MGVREQSGAYQHAPIVIRIICVLCVCVCTGYIMVYFMFASTYVHIIFCHMFECRQWECSTSAPRCTESFRKVRVRVVSHTPYSLALFVVARVSYTFGCCLAIRFLVAFMSCFCYFYSELSLSQPFFIDTYARTQNVNTLLLQSLLRSQSLFPFSSLRFSCARSPLGLPPDMPCSFCTFFRKLGSTWFIYDSQIRYIMIATFNWHDHFFPSLLFVRRVRVFRAVVCRR